MIHSNALYLACLWESALSHANQPDCGLSPYWFSCPSLGLNEDSQCYDLILKAENDLY